MSNAGYVKVQVLGNVGTDPDLRQTPSNKSVCRFRMAASRSYTGQDGSRVEQTTWVTMVAWGQMADAIHRYVKKGRRLLVDGRLQEREYTDKTGAQRKVMEVVVTEWHLLDSPKSARPEGAASPSTDPISFDEDFGAEYAGDEDREEQSLPF